MPTLKLAKLVGRGVMMAAAMTMNLAAEALPSQLAGSWKITRVLPTSGSSCWNAEQAQTLLGSTLTYGSQAMRWRGGEVPLEEITVRGVTDAEFRQEGMGFDGTAGLADLGIRGSRVMEVDLQHEDADVTGYTTEIPGDTILLAGPNRIIVRACGVFYEAHRAAGVTRTAAPR